MPDTVEDYGSVCVFAYLCSGKKTIMKDIFRRYMVFVAGLYFLAAGVVIIVRSTLGTTPISSVNYVVSLNTPLTLGICTFIINMILIAGQLWLVRDRRTRRDIIEIMLQIPFSFVFAAFIDLNMALTQDLSPSGYAAAIALLLAGCVVQAVGVVLEIKPHVAMMSAEAFVKYFSARYNKEFGKVKVCFDVLLVSMAVALMFTHSIEGVREGSVIAACLTGYMVTFLNTRVITRRMWQRMRTGILK